MQQQVAWSTFKTSDTFVTGSAPGLWPPSHLQGSHPAVGAAGAALVYLGALISVPPGMPASIVPSYGTAKCVTALSIVFAELGMIWLL